jgi:hypothetical protein
MPSKLKKLIRERMAKTGERYATALAHLRAQRTARRTAASGTPATSEYAPELIVTRYFGRPVTFAIMPVQGRCVVMLAPATGLPVTEPPRLRWRVLTERGVQ